MLILKSRIRRWFIENVLEDEVLRQDWVLILNTLGLGLLLCWVMWNRLRGN